ncbi:MAG: sugar phosphate isomerase/epimerase family protein [Tepidisphaeraceae bacterium]|jgi:sugar phosphate isomerase/epimerase
MFDLAFSTNAFKKNTLEEAIDAIAAVGYRGLELMADVPHAYPQNMPPGRIAAVQTQLRKHGLTVSNINAFTLFACGDTYHPTWIEDDAAKCQTRIDHTLRSIELAAAFGAKTISLQPGGPLIGTTLTREMAGQRFADGLRAVIPAAKAAGVILAIEPEPGLYIESAAEYREFKAQYFENEPTIRMNCDIGHLFCVGDDPAQVIRSMPDQIAHIHIEDIGANRVHQHLCPGKGAIGFPAIFQAAADVGYTGRITVELYPYESTAAGVAQAAWDHLKPMLG